MHRSALPGYQAPVLVLWRDGDKASCCCCCPGSSRGSSSLECSCVVACLDPVGCDSKMSPGRASARSLGRASIGSLGRASTVFIIFAGPVVKVLRAEDTGVAELPCSNGIGGVHCPRSRRGKATASGPTKTVLQSGCMGSGTGNPLEAVSGALPIMLVRCIAYGSEYVWLVSCLETGMSICPSRLASTPTRAPVIRPANWDVSGEYDKVSIACSGGGGTCTVVIACACAYKPDGDVKLG